MRILVIALVVLLAAVATGVPHKRTAGCSSKHRTGRTISIANSDVDGSMFVTNNVIRLGVTKWGSLNAPVPEFTQQCVDEAPNVGLQYYGYLLPNGPGQTPCLADATVPGCLCEGWGVSAVDEDNASAEGGFTKDEGVLGPLQFVSQASGNPLEAESVTRLVQGGIDLLITHHFRPAATTAQLYEVNVTITNQGLKPLTNLKYIRTMDWDVPPTSFDDCVDIDMGNAGDPSGDIECVHSNGFTEPLPSTFLAQGVNRPIQLGRCYEDPVVQTAKFKVGPSDQGSAWLFNFRSVLNGGLPVGASKNFQVYYGAADNDSHQNSVLLAAKIEAYTTGYPNKLVDGVKTCVRDGVRFIFGFGNVGGDVIVPTCVDRPDCVIKNVEPICAYSSASVTTTTGDCVSLSFEGQQSCN